MQKVLLLITFILATLIATTSGTEILDKIGSDLLVELEYGPSEVYVYMKDYINFDTYKHNGRLLSTYTADERAEIIMKSLMDLSEKSQKSIKQELTISGKSFESFWISNCLLVKSMTKSSVQALAARSDVKEIILRENIKVDPMEEASAVSIKNNTDKKEIEFNLKWVKAPEVWAKGNFGEGMVVGVCDTGLIHNHPAIVNSYRGSLGNGRFNHDYSWKGRGSTPVDSHGHGTHCSGTVAGGVDRKIGVAPKAKLIHCAGLGGVSVVACMQWFLAPTKVDGTSPDTTKRPHVTSHSYRSGASYDREYTALLRAGVHVINSGGNQGPGCGSVNMNTQTKGQISVSALEKNSNQVTRFSARGPSRTAGLVRPSVSAPGAAVVSAAARGGYTAMSGTSMSCPNVAGGVALIWSAVPQLARNIEKTNQVLYESSLGQKDTDCGSTGTPNHKFGYGTVNYEKAVQVAKQMFAKK